MCVCYNVPCVLQPRRAVCACVVQYARSDDLCDVQVLSVQTMQQRLHQVGVWDNRRGVTITGYSALFCFSALCTTLIMALRYGYKQWRGVDDGKYQRVVKSGDV